MGRLRAAPAVIVVALCTACAGGGGNALVCTDIGASPGISITVSRSMADSIKDAAVEVCANECRTHDLDLQPGSDAVDLGCDSTEPEGTCSASMRPNGTLVGFVPVEDLTAGEVTVTVLSGGERYGTTGQPQLVYPNGRDCPGEALQLAVMLDDGALTT